MSRYKRIGNTSLQTAVSWIAGQLAAITNCKIETPCKCTDIHSYGCHNYDNSDWADRHTDLLETFVKRTAPSGSGFDAGTTIDMDKSTAEKLVFHTSFHHMDESGGYTEWTEHTITVRPSLLFGFHVRVSGRDKNGIKEYIHEEFNQWLNTYYAHVLDESDGRDIFLPEYRIQAEFDRKGTTSCLN